MSEFQGAQIPLPLEGGVIGFLESTFEGGKMVRLRLGANAHRRAVSLCDRFGKSPWEGAAAVSVSRGEPREGEIAIPLSGVSFRVTFLHEQKSDGALPPIGGGRRGRGQYGTKDGYEGNMVTPH